MEWLWIALVAVATLFAALWVYGRLQPRDHVATSTITLAAAPGPVWAAITDWRRYPEWLPAVRSVAELRTADGRTGFTEHTKMGDLPLVIDRSEEGRLLVATIASDALPFGGTWTWRLEPQAGGCRVSITEAGFVKPPLFRALARLVFGYHRSMDQFLTALARKFGETAVPSHS